MTQPAQQQPQPSAEDAQAVGRAVTEAAVKADTPEKARADAKAAGREAADRVKLEIPDEQLDAIANAVVGAMEKRGAFDAPIEPVAPPAAPAPGGDTAASQPPAAASAVPVEQPPRKRSFARKFLGE